MIKGLGVETVTALVASYLALTFFSLKALTLATNFNLIGTFTDAFCFAMFWNGTWNEVDYPYCIFGTVTYFCAFRYAS